MKIDLDLVESLNDLSDVLIENNSIYLGTILNNIDANNSGDNTAIGKNSMLMLTTGNNNTSYGTGSLSSTNTGSRNTSVGTGSLYSNTSGYNNSAFGWNAARVCSEGHNNIAIGTSALGGNNTGIDISKNTVIGSQALFNIDEGGNDNIAIGYKAVYDSLTTGTSNIVIGNEASVGQNNTNSNNQIILGHNTEGQGDNSVTLGNSDITDIYMSQDSDASVHCGEVLCSSLNSDNSEITLKKNIIPNVDNTYDIGSEEFKIKDMYVSENSLWIGDNHKVTISGGKMKFRKRKLNYVPQIILTAGGNQEGAISYASTIDNNITQLNQIKLRHWVKYLRSFGGEYANGKVKDLFRDNSDDYDEESNANFWQESDSVLTTNENIKISNNLTIDNISNFNINGGANGQIIKSNGDNTLSWTDLSSVVSSFQLDTFTYNTNSTLTSNTTIISTSDYSFTANKTGLLMIFFNSAIQTESSGNIRFGLKLNIYVNDVILTNDNQPKEIYSEGESSSYAPDLHTLNTCKQININKDDIIKYEVNLTIYQAGTIYIGNNGTSSINKYLEIQNVLLGINENEFVNKSLPSIDGDLDLNENSIKNLSLNSNSEITSTSILDTNESTIIPMNPTNNMTYTINTSIMNEGKILIFKDISGNANNNNIIIKTERSEKIDGNDSYIINENYGKLKIFCHNNNWFII